MSIELKEANHACQTIRRYMQTHMPEHTIFFVVHGENTRQKTFFNETKKILEHPAGSNITDYLNRNPTILNQNNSEYLGLSKFSNKGFMGYFKTQATISLAFINYERFENSEEMKKFAHNIAWYAIKLDHAHKLTLKSNSSAKDNQFEDINSFIIPKLDKFEIAQRNLEADIFTGVFLHLQNNVPLEDFYINEIRKLFLHFKGIIAESRPFPICIEALKFALDELDPSSKKTNAFFQAIEITKNISSTFDKTALQQWSAFAFPAQQMSWNNERPEQILGCALFTNENTHVRSLADLVSEYGKIKPALITHYDNYNPFTNIEINERTYHQKANFIFNLLLDKLKKQSDYAFFIKEQIRQNKAILSGNPIFWFSPLLDELTQKIRSYPAENFNLNDVKKELTLIFHNKLKFIPFYILEDFAAQTFRYRREGLELNDELLNVMTEQNEKFSLIVNNIIKCNELERSYLHLHDLEYT